MIKKVLITLLIASLGVSIFASDLNLKADPHPSSVTLSWDKVDDTVYYDIYKDNEFVVRLDNNTFEYTVENLVFSTEYDFSLASRDASNNTLAADWETAVTETWSGIYRWENKTDKDNNGKLKEMEAKIVQKVNPTYGPFFEVFLKDASGEYAKVFPLFDFNDPAMNEWHKYNEDSVAGYSYRANATMFSTTSMTPGKWKVKKIIIDNNSSSAYILTSVFGMELTTLSEFVFFENEEGQKYMTLLTKGEQGIVNNFLFKNPNPGEEEAFLFVKVD